MATLPSAIPPATATAAPTNTTSHPAADTTKTSPITDQNPSTNPPPPQTQDDTPQTTSTNPPPTPYFKSLNPSAPQSLLLLHGLLSSHLEYTSVTSHLPSYHILAVDLPGHSRSSALPGPYTIPLMTDAIAALIRSHAHNAQAHIVGLSMGGFVALDLARRYPALCLSVFVTGAAPFSGMFRVMASRPWIPFAVMWFLLDVLPDSVYWFLGRRTGIEVRDDQLRREMRGNRRWEVVRDVYDSILGLGWEEIRGISEVRVLNVAAGRQDDVEATREVGRVWREEGITERLGSRGVVVRKAVHAWDLQFPELFAEGVKAWIEGRELPREFEALD
ncbi:Dihydrolipoyllysine-residue acetyltransferase component of acetoin cleaving system [Echria macrotheca]|uniref:Dihydrolipoyllysine-residue acetyltransferase component of acetoin cleaving system n=1 Tax=Echria macrotheca TaxID=438768 RepID=A0AAJ0BKG2_9PEZI|nr:Dihydrolipoyllysine-residue acetyltransferase component of acetoin cleaving system [Echria macrotheca]